MEISSVRTDNQLAVGSSIWLLGWSSVGFGSASAKVTATTWCVRKIGNTGKGRKHALLCRVIRGYTASTLSLIVWEWVGNWVPWLLSSPGTIGNIFFLSPMILTRRWPNSYIAMALVNRNSLDHRKPQDTTLKFQWPPNRILIWWGKNLRNLWVLGVLVGLLLPGWWLVAENWLVVDGQLIVWDFLMVE